MSDLELNNEILSNMAKKAHSILLAGSWAEDRHGATSDIDLVIIALDDNDAKELHRMTQAFGQHSSRATLDCKIYTEKEFLIAKNGGENFFLWSCMQSGKILHGRDIRKEVKLNTNGVKESLWNCISELEHALIKLESSSEFTGCCYQLYESLSTFYFAEKHFLKNGEHTHSKEEFIESILGKEFKIVRERYYWVARKARSESKNLRISHRTDAKHAKREYAELYWKVDEVVNLLDSKVKKLVATIDNF